VEWPPRSPHLKQMDLFLWDVVRDNFYFLPMPTTLHELRTRVTESCADTDRQILHEVWLEVEYRFDVARAVRGTHIKL
jgi:hypothetical protein